LRPNTRCYAPDPGFPFPGSAASDCTSKSLHPGCYGAYGVIRQAIRIGDLGIAAIPFETFSETGLELKARNPFKPAFTVELANGSYGYLPTPEQHALGGYETWIGSNKVQIEATTIIVKHLLEMFAALK
jgi:neutral ceramidase